MNQSKGRRVNRNVGGNLLSLAVVSALVLGTSACSDSSSGSGAAAISAVSVNEVSPAVGSKYGGTIVTLTGEGFTLGSTPSTVRFGALLASQVNVIDDNTLTARVPAGIGGQSVVVSVQNTGGYGAKTAGFRYLVPAKITSDLNNDGIADIAVSAPLADLGGLNAGAVYIFFGKTGVQLDTLAANADIKLIGLSPSGRFGYSVLTGDITGDGIDDIAIGAVDDDQNGDDNGAVYIFRGPLAPGTLNASQANVVLTGETGHIGDKFGSALAIGDVNNDGKVDLAVTAIREDAGSTMTDCGATYLFLDSKNLVSSAAETANVKIAGMDIGDQFGNMVVIADVTGDSIDDLLVSASRHDPLLPAPKRRNAGGVFIFRGGSPLPAGAGAANIIITGEDVDDEFGTGLAAGDIDGDGLKDVMVGAPYNDRLGFDVGRVYLFKGGPTLASGYSANADAILSGQPSNDNFGESLTCGDVNADGMDDVVVGAPRASHGAIRNGRSFVFYGKPLMTDNVATMADMIQTGEPVSHETFGACAKVADWNRDGMADVLVASPGNDGNGPSSGRLYVFRGAQFGQSRNALNSDTMLTGDSAGSLLGTMIANGQ